MLQCIDATDNVYEYGSDFIDDVTDPDKSSLLCNYFALSIILGAFLFM